MTTLAKAPGPLRDAPLGTSAGLDPPAPAIEFDRLTQVGSVLKTLGHPVRLQIIQYLAQGEQRVSHIQDHIGLSQPATSQQLRLMTDHSILARHREGNLVYYRLANDFIWKILDCMQNLSARLSSGQRSLEQMSEKAEGQLP